MPQTYLDRLSITPAERDKLAALGADSPIALMAMIGASRPAFEAFFGGERTAQLLLDLEGHLTPDERARLAQPPIHFPLGALPPPKPR